MAFDLVIGTERAQSLQNSIQEELTRRGYSDDDPVMAEYITIMLINNKTAEQIDAELKDLIGSDYGGDADGQSFPDWLFAEAKKKSQPSTEAASAPSTPAPAPTQSLAPPAEPGRKPQSGIRTGPVPLYNQALDQALSSGLHQSNKRTASARSPSPSGQPNKARRVDVPTGPRAMSNREGGGRSLLDRVGARQPRNNMHQRDDIQARIEAVTLGNQLDPSMMNAAFNNNMGGMMMPPADMAAAMGGGMMNPMMLQEVMMNQMALMAQMANNMGMINNMANVPNGMMPDAQNNAPPQRRGGAPGRGGRRGGGHGGPQRIGPQTNELNNASTTSTPSGPVPIEVPVPKPAVASQRPGFAPPERPQSPSLCKFGLKCTNALCRYSHPSPVATPESGMVLSKESCENGIKCTDKDCVKGHVSPAAAGVTSVPPKTEVAPVPAPTSSALKIPCRYGTGCLKINSGCPYSHPFIPKSAHGQQQRNEPCRFGAACTRANCTFQHPPGRVLPGTFHRGLGENAPVVSVRTPETGSIGAPSPHRSVVFNKPAPKVEGEGGSTTKDADAPAAAVQAAA